MPGLGKSVCGVRFCSHDESMRLVFEVDGFFFASLFHTLLFRGNRQQWFRHSEYTVKSGNGNQASSTICVAIRTTENNFCLVYFLICFCPHPVGYAMFRTRSWILHKAFARSARIRPCMWRIQWRNVYAVRSGT